MMSLIIAIHVISCILLIGIILVQAGRGGGLVESFSNVESMFGPKTNTFLTRATTILSTLFFLTCVSLALLSARQSRSLMRDIKGEPAKQVTSHIPNPEEKTQAGQIEAPKAEAAAEKETSAVQVEVPQKESAQNASEQKKAKEIPKAE